MHGYFEKQNGSSTSTMQPWVQKHSNDDAVRTEQGSLLQWSAMVECLVSLDEALAPHPSTEEKISTIWSHFYNIPQKAD